MFRWFENRLAPFPPQEPQRPPDTLIAFCLHYTRGAWPYLMVATVLMALIAGIEVWMFGFLGNIVDWLAAQDRETFLADQGWKLAGMALIVLVLLPGMVGLHSLFQQQTLMGNFPMRIRWQAHRYLLRQSMGFYQDEFAGRIATKVMQTSLAVRECVIKLFDVLNYVSVYFLGTLILVGNADWRLALPLLAWLIGYLVLLRIFVPIMGRVSKSQADARSRMTGRIVDSYSNIQTVKLFSHAQREAAFAKDGMQGFLVTVHRQMRLVTGLYGLLYLLNALLLFSIGWLSIQLWLGEAVSVGAVAVALGLVMRLWGMSQWIMWEVSALFENIGTVQDGMATLSLPRQIEDRQNAPPLHVEKGEIVFDRIRFHYGKGSGVIDELSLAIQSGEKIGLIGPSGAGKSTLVNLLLRFYELEGGAIRIDGQNIAEVTQESLRAQIGMVTQDTSLLHRSVRDNLLYGRPDATDEMAWKAARGAHVADFIESLRDTQGRIGFDAHVGERGVKLSGGQRQRLAIARVMLKDAPILILDEATSALDSDVEAAIQENLDQLMKGKTVIAIAHRLSTIAAMDRLVVMENGRIVEQGSHAELIRHDGLYARLWRRQSGGFLESEVAATETP
ncbi:ABC transporter ATP-binding protein/permease [Chromohalobacter sp. TMW 2.2308]|uniref:ABC transporter ATP-binding protein/permease n=1 Tax=Chromohalobacter moromii TaxID=2860329 RepID=A0A9X3B3P4_9GAMM|nr:MULTISPECIES: ABC transporter ATP-binding protein [Chromohalobacter]CDQ34267.1 Putative multidrug export ATP-binding/permease protein [Virgibacillus halodenitrificans]MCK2043257.1 ABC transporter ATP-binding protein/permease [Chromohalobacter moromii]MCK2046091.1 ABC transporter ATP-binding protein/permease [Chromohalobacter moromii]MCT8505485.1 ABC transporter ATP-binding protein/permease [Chromohalobacter moromii]MCT8515507.1 ABC transporter ATP-binding protein/permease [Chromohalobacter 